MNAETLLTHLDKVQNRGGSKWMACCPAHDDKSPSLAISELSDGRILLKCFAGCCTPDVLAAVGLCMSDLFPDGGLGEFKGFQRLEDEHRARHAGKIAQGLATEYAVISICDDTRKSGGRLTRAEMAREQQAFLRIRSANNKR